MAYKILSDVKLAISSIKSQLDITKVISDELGQPKNSGDNNFFLCPFHSENTPSFSAHKAMQIYHCFGCGLSGDVISFISRYHGLGTVESIKLLADKYSIDLDKYYREPTPEEQKRYRQLSIYAAVAEYCSNRLFKSIDVLNTYKNETGFSNEQIIDYCVGYSDSVDSIINVAYASGATESDARELELYNSLMWNNAMVYPIKTRSGETIRFHNKPLSPPETFTGKYVGNSISNPLFTNGALFGAHLMTREKLSRLRLFEGQKAAIAGGGLAILGSSIKKEQIETIKSWGVRAVVFTFDGDTAGINASNNLFLDQEKFGDLIVAVSRLPEGHQPDDIVRMFGQEMLDSIINKAVSPIEYYLDNKANGKDFGDILTKTEIVSDVIVPLSKLSDVSIDIASSYLSSKLDISKDSIISRITEIRINSAGLTNKEAESSILKLVIDEPRLWSSVKQSVYGPEYFTNESHKKIFSAIANAHAKLVKVGLKPDSLSRKSVSDELGPTGELILDELLSRSPSYKLDEALFIVVDLYKRRSGIEQSKELSFKLRDTSKTTVQILSEHRKKLVSTLDYKKDTDSTPTSLVSLVEKELQQRSLTDSKIIGYDFSAIIDVDGVRHSCLEGLNLSMSGIQKQHQIVIAAQSGVGKSLMGLQMATAISVCPQPSDQIPVLWIPLEMNKIEITMRMLSMLTGINNTKIQLGKFSKEENLKIRLANKMIAASQFYIHRPSNPNVEEIFAVIDEHVFKYGVKVVFLDYLQMVLAGPVDRGAKREEIIGRASKMMKFQVAEDLGIASVCIAQLNRSHYQEGGIGSIQEIGGSYQISQDADDFFIISAKTESQVSSGYGLQGNRRVFMDKRRGGQSDIIIDMNLDDTRDVSLRFTECIPVQKLAGLARGTE